jgi:hypothetical protein
MHTPCTQRQVGVGVQIIVILRLHAEIARRSRVSFNVPALGGFGETVPTRTVVAVLCSVALCAPSLAQTETHQPSQTEIAVIKVVAQCVAVVHASPVKPNSPEEFSYPRSDAFYNSSTGKVENNVAYESDKLSLFVFRKCMSEKGFPLH